METNNNSKTQEVLNRVHEFLSNLCRDARCDDHCSECLGASDLADDVYDLLHTPPRNCDVGASKEAKVRTDNKPNTIQYGDIFIEVRQRISAFQYWKEFTNQTGLYGITESDYLDEAYRFLYSTASRKFMEFCAAKEGESFEEYCKALDIDVSALI